MLSATTFVSRRFGLAGGLALVVLLASTEGNEILKAFNDNGPQPGNGETIATGSGLKYKDVLVGTSGNTPLAGSVVGIKAKVSIGEKVLFDTASDKPIAFRYGKRPFENVLCEGVEEGVKGMKVGGVRELTVPQNLAPTGIELPPGVSLTYVVEVCRLCGPPTPLSSSTYHQPIANLSATPATPHAHGTSGTPATQWFMCPTCAPHVPQAQAAPRQAAHCGLIAPTPTYCAPNCLRDSVQVTEVLPGYF